MVSPVFISSNVQTLLIEDNPGDARLIREMVKKITTITIELETAETRTEAEEKLASHDYHLVLMDLGLPESSGRETFEKLRPLAVNTAVIVLTGLEDEDTSYATIGLGAQDYLVKGQISGPILSRAIHYALERKTILNTLKEKEARLSAIWNTLETGIVLVDRETRTVADANAMAAQMHGDTVERMLGRPCHEVVCAACEKGCPIIDLQQEINQRECVLTRSDGVEVPILKTVIPVALNGHDYLMESFIDITERKKARESLEFISQAVLGLVELGPEDDVYGYVGKQVSALVPDAYVTVSRIDMEGGILEMRSMTGFQGVLNTLTGQLNRYIPNRQIRFKPEDMRLSGRGFVEFTGGLHEITFGNVPKGACAALEKLMRLGRLYGMAFEAHGVLLGNVAVLLKKGGAFTNQDVVETLIRQASVAIQRKQAGEDLGEAQAFTEAAINAQTDLFVVCDPSSGKPIRWNRPFEQLTGYEAQEITNHSMPNSWHGHRDLLNLAQAEERVRRDGSATVRAHLKTREGGTVPMEYSVTEFSPGKGAARYLVYVGRNIMERQQTDTLRNLTTKVLSVINREGSRERILHETLASVRLHLDVEAAGIRLKAGNDFPYAATAGFEQDHLKKEHSLLAADAGAACHAGRPECMCGQVVSGTTDARLPVFTKAGSFWTAGISRLAEQGLTPGKIGLTRGTCCAEGFESMALIPLRTGRTVTGLLQLNDTRPDRFTPETIRYLEGIADSIGVALARIKAEEEKDAFHKQLLHSQKMEAVGTLAGGVAHDFNNILTIIQGNTELLRMDADSPAGNTEEIDEISKATVRAIGLTRQLLMFSRRQHLAFARTDLNGTVEGLMKMMNRLIGENVAVQTGFEDAVPPIMADPGGIEQIIMNLTLNARDAMPDGGTIFIKTELVVLDERRAATLSYARPGTFACLTVTDTGTGMDEETLSHIFEPFFTTKETGKGTGLGLSVVYGIVKEHNGWINAFSDPGHGTTFRIHLPAVEAAADNDAGDTGAAAYAGALPPGLRVLLVEDDEGVRRVAWLILKGYEVNVTEVTTGEEAVRVFDERKGDFDLVFSDVVLPDISGVKVVEMLRAKKPDLKVALTSGYTDMKSQWEIIRDKGITFIQKPYSVDDLMNGLDKALKE